jgi:WD40 repeat protein
VDSLKTIHEISLTGASELPGPPTTLLWSPSSRRVLIATSSHIYVFGALRSDFRAVIRVPPPAAAKPSFIFFGPDDGTVCAFSALGLKLSLFDLSTSKVVEINNPKFYQPVSAARCVAFRPQTSHLAILTRTSGRDVISIHAPTTWEVQTSWYPDLIDAQGLLWASGGKWLVAWESPSQGHKVVFFTPEGHVFRTWTGPSRTATSPELEHFELGAGVRHCQLSPDTSKLAVCDHTRFVHVLKAPSGVEETRLHHPTNPIVPRDGLQVSILSLTPACGCLTRIQVVQHVLPRITVSITVPLTDAGNTTDLARATWSFPNLSSENQYVCKSHSSGCSPRTGCQYQRRIGSKRWKHSSLLRLLFVLASHNGRGLAEHCLDMGPSCSGTSCGPPVFVRRCIVPLALDHSRTTSDYVSRERP